MLSRHIQDSIVIIMNHQIEQAVEQIVQLPVIQDMWHLSEESLRNFLQNTYNKYPQQVQVF